MINMINAVLEFAVPIHWGVLRDLCRDIAFITFIKIMVFMITIIRIMTFITNN